VLNASLPASIICNSPALISDAWFFATALYRNQLSFGISGYLNGTGRIGYGTYLYTGYAHRFNTLVQGAPAFDMITFQASEASSTMVYTPPVGNTGLEWAMDNALITVSTA
jgi:hypothetical protein